MALIYIKKTNYLEHKRSFSTSINLIPIIKYNAGEDKYLIIQNNKKKSGIYRWVHIKSNKCYIGSSINLSNRLAY